MGSMARTIKRRIESKQGIVAQKKKLSKLLVQISKMQKDLKELRNNPKKNEEFISKIEKVLQSKIGELDKLVEVDKEDDKCET